MDLATNSHEYGYFSKEFEDFRFKYIKNYSIDKIKEEILKLDKEWFDDNSRQIAQPSVHKETNSFFLAEFDADWIPNTEYKTDFRYKDYPIWEFVQPIINDLENFYNGKIGKVVFPKLKAGQKIYKHKDTTDYLNIIHRIHIPIITNKDIMFYIDDGVLNMFEGECWEINNMKSHEVINDSDEDRIHLMIDIIPNEYINDN